MNIDLDELKNVTDEALIISMVKMLVFQELKNKINKIPNKFYKPRESDLKTQDNFNVFIKNLADKIFEEIKNDKSAYRQPSISDYSGLKT